jgi:hypothetical protein
MNAPPDQTKSNDAAIGFRVKSGWASAVLLAGPVQSPRVVDATTVALSDSAIPETRQPYHAGTGLLETDNAKVDHRTEIIERCTMLSVAKLLKGYRDLGLNLWGAALAVGSMVEPATIANPHIRAHALEGRLFRTVLEQALQAGGLLCSSLVERKAYAEAAAVLHQTEDSLKQSISRLGHSLAGPWRAEQKMAALVAWMVLAKPCSSVSIRG